MEWAVGIYLGWCLAGTLMAYFPVKLQADTPVIQHSRWGQAVRIFAAVLQVRRHASEQENQCKAKQIEKKQEREGARRGDGPSNSLTFPLFFFLFFGRTPNKN